MDTGEAITVMVDVARGEEAEIGLVLARRVRRVYAMVGLVRADIAAFTPTFIADPASWARLDKHEVEAVAAHEVSMVFGVSPLSGAAMVDQAVHLVEVLPRTLAALAAGTLDLNRVRHLVAATSTTDLSVEAARVVEDAALAGAGAGPWEGPTIQVFKARVRRAVLRVQSATAQAEAAQVAQRTAIMVELDQDHAGLALLKVCGPTQDIMWLSRTLYDLGEARPSVDPDGNRVSTGRRQVGALFDLVERAVLGEHRAGEHSAGEHRAVEGSAGDDSAGGDSAGGDSEGEGEGGSAAEGTAANAAAVAPTRPSRREPGRSRELGLVLHADTFFGHGPAAGDPGEIRGFGVPIPVSAGPARAQAQRAVESGTPTCVLLAGTDGTLHRLVRVGTPPATGWTPNTLNDAVHRALAKGAGTPAAASNGAASSSANGGLSGGAALATDRYTPTTAIADHVRAYYPTCTAPTCNRSARSCDLDHDEPWPRGPTATTNLNPKSRRCHRWKTLGLWRSRMHPDGTITWTTLTTTVSVKPEPLPGYGHAEGHHATRTDEGHPGTPAA